MNGVFGPENGYTEYEYRICIRHHNKNGRLASVERIVSDADGVIYKEVKRADVLFKDNSPIRKFEEWLNGERSDGFHDGKKVCHNSCHRFRLFGGRFSQGFNLKVQLLKFNLQLLKLNIKLLKFKISYFRLFSNGTFLCDKSAAFQEINAVGRNNVKGFASACSPNKS